MATVGRTFTAPIARLLRSAFGVFDHTSIETVRRIRAGKTYNSRVTIVADDLAKLLNVIDQGWPGLIDEYIDRRLAGPTEEETECDLCDFIGLTPKALELHKEVRHTADGSAARMIVTRYNEKRRRNG